MQILEARALPSGGPHVVPRLVRQALHVVGHVLRELDDRASESILRADSAGGKSALDELREHLFVDLAETDHGPRLVERPPGREHPFHQRRFRSRKDITNGALFLHGGAKRVLDIGAVKGGDRLELVERDGHALSARRRDPGREGKNFRGKPSRVAYGADGGKRDGESRLSARLRVESQFRADGCQQLGRPPPQPVRGRVGGQQRSSIGLEEPHIGAGRGHRHFDREDPLHGKSLHDVTDQRRLAVPAWGNQEHLLPLTEVAREPLPLVLAIGEGGRSHHFAVDERIGCRHYVIIRNDYVKSSNDYAGPCAFRAFSASSNRPTSSSFSSASKRRSTSSATSVDFAWLTASLRITFCCMRSKPAAGPLPPIASCASFALSSARARRCWAIRTSLFARASTSFCSSCSSARRSVSTCCRCSSTCRV